MLCRHRARATYQSPPWSRWEVLNLRLCLEKSGSATGPDSTDVYIRLENRQRTNPLYYSDNVEDTGFEPVTFCLPDRYSTAELIPQEPLTLHYDSKDESYSIGQ